MNRIIDLEILREILSGVKTEHKNSLEASSIINEVWKEVLEYSESERKKGTWILQYNKHSGTTSACFYYFPRCSNCGKSSANETNFCPNCGADMRKGGEED